MILQFATKRDRNGNRKFLGIDTGAQCYATESRSWYTKNDIIEITGKERNSLIEQLQITPIIVLKLLM